MTKAIYPECYFFLLLWCCLQPRLQTLDTESYNMRNSVSQINVSKCLIHVLIVKHYTNIRWCDQYILVLLSNTVNIYSYSIIETAKRQSYYYRCAVYTLVIYDCKLHCFVLYFEIYFTYCHHEKDGTIIYEYMMCAQLVFFHTKSQHCNGNFVLFFFFFVYIVVPDKF